MLLRTAAAIAPRSKVAPSALGHGNLRFASSAATGVVEKVGFVGLGAMGIRMARQLLSAGNHLLVYDSNPYALERLLGEAEAKRKAEGPTGGSVEAVRSPADLAERRGVSVVFTMLPGAAVSREVYLGADGLLAPAGGIVPRVLVECTTLDPPTARDLAARVRAARINSAAAGPPLPGLAPESPTLLDAPVTGGIVGADKGSLSFLIGGEPEALHAVEPLLRAMGSTVTLCGDPGDAQAARLCNTMVQAATMAATAEALALAKRLGVDPEVMTKVLNSGSGRSWVSSEYNPVPGITPDAPPSTGYRGGLRSAQVLTHLNLAVDAAGKSHSPVPITRQVLELYNKVVDEGMGDQDFASIYRYVYGSGFSSNEWRSGETLFNAQHL